MADPDRQAELRALFDRAAGLGKVEQDALVASIADELLRERLIALLLQDVGQTAAVLREPLVGTVVASGAASRRIGNYELLRPLGKGGMGVVMLARQVEPFERLVAVKLVADAAEGSEILQRFRAEQRALGRMEHPGIARVLDGGSTDDGVPFFVMEYVRGEPITKYCDRRRLSVAQRLRLLAEVADAVQHAHQKGVIHRDLKPGNVLVTEVAGRPHPKVIDFGVARAIAGRLATIPPTRVGEVVGTLLYMSPEQAMPDQELDTRTDIWSLGVIGFELLVGQTPLMLGNDAASLLQFRTALAEGRVPTVVAAVTQLDAEIATKRAERRASTVAGWRRELGADIGWILAMALHVDRNHRYATAAELATDLRHYLAGEPVLARAPTWRYLAQRFVQRHRAGVLAATFVALAVVGGGLAAAFGMLDARAARDEERLARQRLAALVQRQQAVQEFSEFVQLYGDPGTGDRAPSLRQALLGATAMIDARWRALPRERAAVRAALGRTLLHLGEPALAMVQLQEVWDVLEATGHDDPTWSLEVLVNLRRAARESGDTVAARRHLVRMLEFGGAVVREQSAPMAELLTRMARDVPPSLAMPPAFVADCGRAVDLMSAADASAGLTRTIGPLLFGLALAARREELAGGDALLQRLEGIARQQYGDDVEFALLLGSLAENRWGLRDGTAALALADELLAVCVRLDLASHWLTAQAARLRGLALVANGDDAGGENELLRLRDRLLPFRATGNAQVRSAIAAPAELARWLHERDRLATFLRGSFTRWQTAATPVASPWWPAYLDDAPQPVLAAGLAVIDERTEPPAALRGALLLRLGRAEAALPVLESALAAAAAAPSPELLADVAVARQRLGDATGSSAALAQLAKLAADAPATAVRCQIATERAHAARR